MDSGVQSDIYGLKLWKQDEWLYPYRQYIKRIHEKIAIVRQNITGYGSSLLSSVNSHLYYGVHLERGEYVFREYAPSAINIYLLSPENEWKKNSDFCFLNIGNGNWEFRISASRMCHGELYKLLICWDGGEGERIPAYSRRVLQDPITKIFAAQIWNEEPYKWKNSPVSAEFPLIYEAHIGMSGEECAVHGYNYFRREILPRIAASGYNTIQLMALQEHPYYGSFGYQVSSFFAASSRFGSPDELKALIDDAHGYNLSVIMDIVHSHAVSNVLEGLSEYDGSDHLYFHKGGSGVHPLWKSRCFDYGKEHVIRFLLSNCKYWMEEFNLDGFRFDGITSMIYKDHGINRNFMNYADYFSENTDQDALVYLGLANQLIREIRPEAITVAEDMSGYPGLASPYNDGGIGFGYRMSMGIADHWIKLAKEKRDEEWSVGNLWWELTNKRSDEQSISYVECHDQALVGDKTMFFRFADKDAYFSMSKDMDNVVIDRGIALINILKLLTISTAGGGYLNFMGNEFGHPEWIDFPRAGNGWSFYYARRQWSLADNAFLKYSYMGNFDRALVTFVKEYRLLNEAPELLLSDEAKQIVVYNRKNFIFVVNISPVNSYTDYLVPSIAGDYKIVLDTDSKEFGGFERNDAKVIHSTIYFNGSDYLSLYLPSRSAFILKRDERPCETI